MVHLRPQPRAGSLFLSIVAVACVASCCNPRVDPPVPEDAALRYADIVCSAYDRCGCVGSGFSTTQECRLEQEALFRRVSGWSGVEFDADCFERVLQSIGEIGCGAADVRLPCQVFSGGEPLGAQCVPDWSPNFLEGHPGMLAAGQCDNGWCRDGTCSSGPAQTVGLGEACHLESGLRCGFGLFCAPDGVCRERVPLGEPCGSPRACDSAQNYCAGLTVDGENWGICSPRKPAGMQCDPEEIESCKPPSSCWGGVCTEWPGVCFSSGTPPPDFYLAHQWIPEHS